MYTVELLEQRFRQTARRRQAQIVFLSCVFSRRQPDKNRVDIGEAQSTATNKLRNCFFQ